MKRTRFALLGIILLLFAATAASAELSPRELKKRTKEASKAWTAGEVSRAIEIYEEMLAATTPGDAARGVALYAVAMASLNDEATAQARARELLSELLGKHPEYPQYTVAQGALTLLEALHTERAQSARVAEALKVQQTAGQNDRKASQSLETQASELSTQLAEGQEQLATMDSQLKAARGNLADCEAKLKKVRDTLVGGGG
jgi:hypothetical protein